MWTSVVDAIVLRQKSSSYVACLLPLSVSLSVKLLATQLQTSDRPPALLRHFINLKVQHSKQVSCPSK